MYVLMVCMYVLIGNYIIGIKNSNKSNNINSI